jgi:hypothetical protein
MNNLYIRRIYYFSYILLLFFHLLYIFYSFNILLT